MEVDDRGDNCSAVDLEPTYPSFMEGDTSGNFSPVLLFSKNAPARVNESGTSRSSPPPEGFQVREITSIVDDPATIQIGTSTFPDGSRFMVPIL